MNTHALLPLWGSFSYVEDKPIDWNTFEAIVGSFMENSGPREDELLEAFKVFDREGNGTISAAELKHLVAGASSDDEMEANSTIEPFFLQKEILKFFS